MLGLEAKYLQLSRTKSIILRRSHVCWNLFLVKSIILKRTHYFDVM